MEYYFLYHKHMRNEKTVRAVPNKKIGIWETDINGNEEKIDEIAREINRIKQTIRTRRRKNRANQELSLRVNE